MPPPTCHPRATHLIDARRARQARPAGEFDAGPGERQGILVDVAEGLLGTALLDREPSAESSEADCAPEVESILKRLGIDGSMWLDLVWSFKKYYQGSAAGMPDTLARDASAHQHRWRRGQRAVRRIGSLLRLGDGPRLIWRDRS